MLPAGEISSSAVISGFAFPVKGPKEEDKLQDWELGGVALNNSSEGLLVKVWRAFATKDTDTGTVSVFVEAPGVPAALLFTGPDITEIALSFDQNMNPFVAYTQGSAAKIYWYDPLVPGMTHTTLPAGCRTLRCTMDERRSAFVADSDILLCYIRAGNFCIRYQRERYLTEHILRSGVGANCQLVSMARNNGNRIQWRLRNYENTDDPNALFQTDPFLAETVTTICRAAGIKPENIDVSELWNDTVPGLMISTDDGLDKPIDWLRDIYMFDKQDANRRIRFLKRGREAVARIPYKDLVVGKPQSLKKTTVDETKLPKEISIQHLDPTGGFAKNKQTAQRRSNTINAQEKPNLTTQVVLTPDQAATAAMVKLKVKWNELLEYEFSTRLKYSFVCAADVVEVEDADGNWHRIRIEEKNEDDGEIQFEGVQDGGARAYGAINYGNALPDPISTTPGLAGETRLEIINVSPNADQHDELGVYVAASGENSAWSGYSMLVSTDQGQSYNEAFQSSTPCVLGETLTDLKEEIGYQYQSQQSVEVTTNFPLSSINYDQLLGNQNRCIIGDEELQFMNVTLLGMVGSLYHYRLSGLIRARYNTKPEFWPIGTRFILMDEAVIFLQAQQWMIGVDMYYKAVSFNTSSDETTPLAYLFDEPHSQLEWPPAMVTAERDGSDNVTVNWIEVARLGLDTTPYHSKYTTGYRVKFSNGHSIDVPLGTQTATYNSAPSGITVQVVGINSITGEGEPSTAIPT